MKTIKITALTKVGETALKIEQKKNPMQRQVTNMLGMKFEIESESPLIILVKMKRVPDFAIKQICFAYDTFLQDHGAVKDTDYKVEVLT